MIGAAIGAAAGVAGSIFGGVSASKARRKANKMLDQMEKDNQSWYDRRYNEDYTQSAEAQSLLSKSREMALQRYKSAAAGAAVSGATDESVALEKRNTTEALGDTMSSIAAQGTARKDAIESQYMQAKQNIGNQRISLYNQQAANAAQAGGAAMQAGMGLVGADMSSILNTGKGVLNNLFKKKGDA